MKIIDIGVIGEFNKTYLDKLIMDNDGLTFRLFTNNLSCDYGGCRVITVGDRSADIKIDNATGESITEYITALTDILISDTFNYIGDKVRLDKKSLYIVGDKAYLGLKEYDITGECVAKYISGLFDELPILEDKINPKWSGAYTRFFKRYKRKSTSDSFNENIDKESKLNGLFTAYDSRANKYNSIYRSSLYFRALFPLLSTFILALALNTRSLGGFIFGGAYWGFVSAVFFIVQASFNYIIISLSDYVIKNKVIENFIHSRFMAESIRMIMLTAPNSLPRACNRRIVFTDINGDISTLNNQAKQVYREHLNLSNTFDSVGSVKVMDELNAIASNQLGYHKTNAANCERASVSLGKLARIFFIIGLAVVLGRAAYQLIVQFYTIGGSAHGVDTGSFLLGIVNFLALLIPSFTALFLSLKTGLNFDNNIARSVVMTRLLEEYVDALSEAKTKEVGYCELQRFTNELSGIFMEETMDWHTATEQKKVSKM